MALPPGLATRPLRPDDAAAVTAVMAAEELAYVGRVSIELADIVADWSRPSADLEKTTLGIFSGADLVAYGEVSSSMRGDAAVHPDHHGRGIGTFVAQWMQARARELGYDGIGMPVPAGSPGERLLRELGYQVRWNSWVLALPDGADIAARDLPDGYRLAVAASDDDRLAAWHVTEDAFLEWSDRSKDTFEDWDARVTRRPGFEPWMLRLVKDADGEVVAAVSVQLADRTGYVDKVAVRPDQRGRGLAQALLVDAFAAARAHGAARSELATDSRTGALDLYLKIGMEIDSDWVNLGVRFAVGS
ncbi:MAG TPA: GNAT family N-acetyltransferase [Marmoricola sp.]|nr:GNAT family N-acetyltransferase [Marmoricola sp.]